MSASEATVNPPAQKLVNHQFEFRGSAGEYFGIWIVNLLLSIITIGIYTAWAKVRRLRYFYGNTYLDGHNFEYHARPVQILIGRLIVVGLLLLTNILIDVVSPFFALLFVPYLIALPWLINKALAFNARMTSYRNVRLSFRGSYWRALGIFVLLFIAIPFSLFLLTPVYSRKVSNYLGNNTFFGTSRFATNAPLGALYGNFGMSVLFVLIATAGFGFIGIGAGGLASRIETGDADLQELLANSGIFSAVFGGYVALFLAFLFYGAGVRNVAYNATTLDGKHQFVSSVGRLRYVWILVSNLIVTLSTLALMRPWAVVRTWRYLAGSTAVLSAGSLEGFVDQAAPEGSVAAAEYFDIEGIDFGL